MIVVKEIYFLLSFFSFYEESEGSLILSVCGSSEVYIKASSKGRPYTIREVKASNIGQLVRISGIVTRCSDVKPLMQVAVYTCEECGFEIYQVSYFDLCLTSILGMLNLHVLDDKIYLLLYVKQEVTARIYMPLFDCPSEQCKVNQAKGNLIPQLRASKFLKFQEVWNMSMFILMVPSNAGVPLL